MNPVHVNNTKYSERYIIRDLNICPRIHPYNAHLCVSLAVASLLLAIAFIVNIVGVVGNGLGAKNSTKDAFDTLYIAYTPSGWTFSIFGVYAWQVVWVVYTWTIIFRPLAPHTIHWGVNVLFSIANVANIIWVLLWGNLQPHIAFAFAFIVASCLIASVGVECVYLHRHATLLHQSKADLWLTRVLVLNGFVTFATWQYTVIILNNFGIILRYYAGVSDTLTVTLILSFLMISILVYFILENAVLDGYTRNLYFVYPVAIWALSGSLYVQSGVENQKNNYIFTLVLLVTTILLFIIRIVLLIIFNHFSQKSLLELVISLFMPPQARENDDTPEDKHTNENEDTATENQTQTSL